MSGVDVTVAKLTELNMDLLYDGLTKPGWNVINQVLDEFIQTFFELESLWPNSRAVKRTKKVFEMWVNSSPDVLVR
jgi:hypothetical protein